MAKKNRNRNRDASNPQSGTEPDDGPDEEETTDVTGLAVGATGGAGSALGGSMPAASDKKSDSKKGGTVEIPEALAPLVEKLRTGRCVLWAGAQLEKEAGGSGFRGVLEKLIAELPSKEEAAEARELMAGRPFLVAGFIRRRLGDRVGAAFKEAGKGPAELPEGIRILGELPFRAVITTGYSDIMVRAFTRDGAAPVLHTPADASSLKRDGRGRYVLKALGDPAREGTVIFSSVDMKSALNAGGLAATLQDLYQHRTLLFLGIDSLDVQFLFGRILSGPPPAGIQHYALVSGMTRIEREELESVYGLKILDEKDDFSLVRALRKAVGDVHEAVPDDDDVEGWVTLLSAEPDRADARQKITALEESLRAKKDDEKLLELHLGMVEIETEASRRAARLRDVARIFEKSFGDLGKAFTALSAAYKEDPENQVATDIERLAEATGSWTELLGEYVEMAPTLPELVRGAHWVRVARLYGDKIGHLDYALNAVDEALKAEPGRREAMELKVDLLRKSERWKELVVALEALVTGEESAARKSEIHLEQGDLYESRLSDGPAAAKAYRAALAADPKSSDAVNSLEVLHRRRGEFKELVAVLDEKAKIGPADRALEFRKEAAALVAEHLNDKKSAIERYEGLRNDSGSDLDVLRALERLYESDGRTDDYLAALAAQVELIRDVKEKLGLFRRLASQFENRTDGRARAADYLEKILAADPAAEDALRSVERLYALDKKWEALVDAYKRHSEMAGADRGAYLVLIAQTLDREVGNAGRAIDAWSDVLKLQPESDDAMSSLARLYEKTEAWQKALDLLDRRASQSKDKDQKVKILFESGRLAADKMGDAKKAEELYHRALGVDPTHVPSMQAVVEHYRKSGEFLRAANLLVEAETYTQNRLEKTRMLVEAGEIYDSLDQHTVAQELLLRALAVDPEHVEAANRVTELLWKAQAWTELVPVLEMLTRKESDKVTQKTRFLRLGKAARSLGHNEKAAKAYTKAAEIDPADQEAQSARGQLLFVDKKWSEARDAFKSVLGHHGDTLKDPDRVELYYNIGECDKQLGEIDKAKYFYAKALAIDPNHRPTILSQIDVEGDDPKRLIEAKKALLATASVEEKQKLLPEIARLHLKLDDKDAALALFNEALLAKADSRSLLHEMLDVQVEKKDWKAALETLGKLTEIEQVPSVRAKLRYARAAIHLEELQDTESAIRLFTESMDDDPVASKAPARLEELLVQTENWKELTRYHRKVIKRLPAEADNDTPEMRSERLRLWSTLADTLIDKVGDLQSGVFAFEVAATFDRGNMKRQEQLADLYIQAGPTYLDKAVASHHNLLRDKHDRIASYRALQALYQEMKQPEKSLAVAYALAFLKKGDPDDAQRVADAKKRPFTPAKRNLDDDLWQKQLAHPDENHYVSALFAQLLPTLSVANSKPHKDVGLNPKSQIAPNDPRSFAKGIRYVAGVLNVTMPLETYVKPEQREALAIGNCLDVKMVHAPCLVVGGPMLAEKRPERELVYELAKRLAFFRTERYLKFVLAMPPQLGMVIDAAISLAAETDREKTSVPLETGKIAQDFKRALPPKSLEQVVSLGKKLKGQKGIDLATTWLAATELTATRAALLLVGDLETTARYVAGEPTTVSTHPATHRLKELIYFSITEECFALRKHLGLMP